MALFPSAYPLWTSKRDNTDLVEAAHVNLIQDELDATQRALGTGITVTTDQTKEWYSESGAYPNSSAGKFWAFTGTVQSKAWLTVDERLDNIEKAALRDLDFNYVSILGGSVIAPALSSVRKNGGGVAVVLPSSDSQPAVSIMNPGDTNWATGKITLWADGHIAASQLALGSMVLDTTGLAFGSVQVKTDRISVGNTVIRADLGNTTEPLLTLRPPSNVDGETIFLQNNSGGVRNVIHIKDSSGTTKFKVDTNGLVTATDINLLNSPKDTSSLDIDGVHLDQYGLVFTRQGGAYRPGGLVFNTGGGLTGKKWLFDSKEGIYAQGSNIVSSGDLLISDGGILARGMTTRLYEVSGVMYIPIPQDPGGPQGVYAPPKVSAGGATRNAHMPFQGPPTGIVEVHLSVAVRAYSRPVYVSYQVVDMVTGSLVVDAQDRHGVINNGARSAEEQTDVDEVRVNSFAVWRSLVPGRNYEIRIQTRAADTGKGDVGKAWTQANGCRVLIRPVMTAYTEAWV